MFFILNSKTLLNYLLIALFSFFTISFYAQVGVGTTLPKGALDITSATTGFVMPRIALTATNVSAPVTNPNGLTLEVGTMVFNTATTAGTYGVIPGLYFWDGARWVSQFHKYFEKNFTQSAGINVATTASSYTIITGLNDVTFIAPYSGEYHFVFSGYLGAEEVDASSKVVGFVEGNFKLTINNVDYKKYSYSVSLHREASGGEVATDYYQLFNETNITANVVLTAGQTCTIRASYNGAGDDNINAALPHVVGSTAVLGNLCEVNISYIGR